MSATVAADQASRLTLDVLQSLLTGDAGKQVGVRLWDGTRWPNDSPRPATLDLKHPGALRACFCLDVYQLVLAKPDATAVSPGRVQIGMNKAE